MLCSICIATYKRPGLLQKLLESLSRQKLPDGVDAEIIVVDNDSAESARIVVEKSANSLSLNVKYFMQPEKNISLTRNKAVAESKGDYILFIDDDELASPEWIKNIYHTLKKYNADGVFGRVVSYFEPGSEEWLKKCFLYNRPAPPTGTIAKSTRTGNCIIKTSLLRSVKGPFEPAYGLTGGSDTKLFHLLIRNGAKFVNCYEAVTYEYVPPERTKFKWLFIRAFRTGNNFVRRKIEFSGTNKFFIRIKFLFIGSIYALTGLCLSILFLPIKAKRTNWFLKFAANIGKVAAVLGYYPTEYI